jgi:alpha-tubulin suppressor-like RCC1 family protein
VCAAANACFAESADHCGARCDRCGAPAFGAPFCDNTSADFAAHACDFTCPAGFTKDALACVCNAPGLTLCGDACVPQSATQCGAACRNCLDPAAFPLSPNAIAGSQACSVAGACDYSCPNDKPRKFTNALGQADCGTASAACGLTQQQCPADVGVCVAFDDVRNCGTCGNDCLNATLHPVPAGGTGFCAPRAAALNGFACDFRCPGGQLKAGGACVAPAALALGANHTCVVTAGGGLSCFGANSAGQLGIAAGDVADRNVPADVALPGATVVAAAAGAAHTCAVLATGEVRCWGSNSTRQLGVPAASTVPVAVPLPAGVTARTVQAPAGATIAAGVGHTCLIAGDNTVRCWGRNGQGQLGSGDLAPQPNVVTVQGLAGQTPDAIAAGDDHTCVHTTANAVFCWGANASGQAQPGSTGNVASARPVAGSWASVAAGGAHSCAASTNSSNDASCWGDNAFGELGDGTQTSNPAAPVPAVRLSGKVNLVAAGRGHTCDGLRPETILKCAGANNAGQLGGAGAVPPIADPAPGGADVSLGGGVDALAAGGDHNCVIATNGLSCWGKNDRGQLGDGTTTNRNSPVQPRPF